MENKIQTLRRCIGRVAFCRPFVHLHSDDSRAMIRFVALWQARNRRTRVMMERAKCACSR